MKHKKKQQEKHLRELKKNSIRLRKRFAKKETKQIRIDTLSYQQINQYKQENGKTMSFWINEAWKWYWKEVNFKKDK